MPSPPGPPASRSRSRSADQTTDRAHLNRVWETTVAPRHRSAVPNAAHCSARQPGGYLGQHPGGQGGSARPNQSSRRSRDHEAGRINRGPSPPGHADAPLETRGIVSPNRYEGGRFESENSCKTPRKSRGTIESMCAMFQEHTRAMDTKEAVILKEIRDSVTQLGERVSWVEHVQEDSSGSVRATTRRC